MTKKGKFVFILVLIVAILLKEEVYGLLLKANLTSKTNDFVCEIKNEELESKYNELVNAYNYDDTLPYHLEESKILFRNIYDLTDHITIYKGENNKIQEKNLVINELGLVGIVSKVHKNSSEVSLLLNKDLNLSVKINENYGILKYENNELVIKGINNQGEANVGEEVFTSDISIYPANILIGTIKEITYDNYEIEKIIKVEPNVDFNNLKYLSIITDLRGTE